MVHPRWYAAFSPAVGHFGNRHWLLEPKLPADYTMSCTFTNTDWLLSLIHMGDLALIYMERYLLLLLFYSLVTCSAFLL